MKNVIHLHVIMLFMMWTSIAWSDNSHPHGIIIDGTMGSKEVKALEGPDYHIPAERGEIKGNNLFHSFQTFNVHNNEHAIFYGPDNVHHIISRVTGSDYSWIDGGIQSMMPEADIFLFNPNGIFLGPNAFLDIQGSFHVSTCEYIGFADHTKYETTSTRPLLTAASPVSFGFVDSNYSPIHIQGKGVTAPLPEHELLPSLYVNDDHTISLIAGDIVLIDGTIDAVKNFPVGTILSDNGRVNIASVASTGEVFFQADGLDVSSFEKMGDIRLSSHSVVSASSGQVYIYGNHLKMETSYINAGQYSSDGHTIEGFAGGSIDIHVNQLSILDGSGIIIETFGTENSGDISIHAENILMKGNCEVENSKISTSSISLEILDKLEQNHKTAIPAANEKKYGNAGNINIYTGNLYLSDGSTIEANVFSRGNGGTISIKATDTIDIRGNLTDALCGILAISISDYDNGGHAGDIQIQANNLILQNGGKIKSSTGGTARGGLIDIHVDENLIIKSVDQGVDIDDPAYEKISGIFSITQSAIEHQGKAGNAGNISLSGKFLQMEQYSNLNVSSDSKGNAGKIYLEFDTIELERYAGIHSVSVSDGNSGNIFLQSSKHLTLNQYAMIGVQSLGTGKPGGIVIDAPKITLDNYSTVSATSLHADNTNDGLGVIIGQDIVLYEEESDFDVHQSSDLITIKNHSEITTESYGMGQAGIIYMVSQTIDLDEHALVSSSSMKQGNSGNSGEIALFSETMSLNHESTITTENAGMGDAGTIKIFTSNLMLDYFSKIHSVNTYGKDGGASGLILVCKEIESILPDDQTIIHPVSNISMNNDSGFSTSSLSEGGAGGIVIRSENLVMSNNAFISAENIYPGFSNNIGIISIRGEKIRLSSRSKISTQSESEADAGGIAIETKELFLTGKSYISSAGIHPNRQGAGGHILVAEKITHIDDLLFGFITIADEVELIDIFKIKEPVNTLKMDASAYISTSSAGSGGAGGILIGSQNVFLSGESRISSESTSTIGGGNAGHIVLDYLQNLRLIQNSKITTQAVNTSVPDKIIPDFIIQDRLNGMISIFASEDIHLIDGSISSSVLGGLGNGGNISIHSNDTILNRSGIIANAYEGNGGNIYISANYLIQSSDSIISASSDLGIDGNIVIEAFTENFDQQIITLADNFLDGSQWVQTPCHSRDNDNVSHFLITLKKVQPRSFVDWQPGRYK
jgi:filamentous hemagglutinin family protein